MRQEHIKKQHQLIEIFSKDYGDAYGDFDDIEEREQNLTKDILDKLSDDVVRHCELENHHPGKLTIQLYDKDNRAMGGIQVYDGKAIVMCFHEGRTYFLNTLQENVVEGSARIMNEFFERDYIQEVLNEGW